MTNPAETRPADSGPARDNALVTDAMVLLNNIETTVHMSFTRVAQMAEALESAIAAIDVDAERVPQPVLACSLAVTKMVLADMTRLDVAVGGAISRAERLSDSLETAIEAGVKTPFQRAVQAAPAPADPRAEHRRAHRPGTLPRITCDPEVEAFILGIIETMTYAQVVEAVARAFPPDRHISASSLQRWWRKRSPALKAQPRARGCS